MNFCLSVCYDNTLSSEQHTRHANKTLLRAKISCLCISKRIAETFSKLDLWLLFFLE